MPRFAALALSQDGGVRRRARSPRGRPAPGTRRQAGARRVQRSGQRADVRQALGRAVGGQRGVECSHVEGRGRTAAQGPGRQVRLTAPQVLERMCLAAALQQLSCTRGCAPPALRLAPLRLGGGFGACGGAQKWVRGPAPATAP